LKLQGSPSAGRNSVKEGFWAQEFTRRRKKFQAAGGLERFPPLFTFLPAVRVTVTCNERKTSKQ
jgi:hypothetical protein